MFILDVVYSCPSLIGPAIKFVKILIGTVMIAVPIILVIMGALDFGKAVVEKEESKMKAAQDLFIKRVITGVCIFLIYTFVNIVMSIIGRVVDVDSGEYNWAKCWTNPTYDTGVDCGVGQIDNGAGQCVNKVCETGRFLNSAGECALICGANEVNDGLDKCISMYDNKCKDYSETSYRACIKCYEDYPSGSYSDSGCYENQTLE